MTDGWPVRTLTWLCFYDTSMCPLKSYKSKFVDTKCTTMAVIAPVLLWAEQRYDWTGMIESQIRNEIVVSDNLSDQKHWWEASTLFRGIVDNSKSGQWLLLAH
jgi:hypothetical protein